MDILVFLSKDHGLSLFKYVFNSHPKDQYRIIVCSKKEHKVIEYLEKLNLKYNIYSKDIIHSMILEDNKYNWLLNLWGNIIIPEKLINKAKRSLNIHPSLLPYGRGRDPIVWAIKNNHPVGVTLHAMTPEVDTGPIWCQKEIPYTLPITSAQLYEKVIKTSIDFFCKHWNSLRITHETPHEQKEGRWKINKRCDLLNQRVININDKRTIEEMIIHLLAFDYSADFSAQLHWNNRKYNVKLNLTLVNDDMNKLH